MMRYTDTSMSMLFLIGMLDAFLFAGKVAIFLNMSKLAIYLIGGPFLVYIPLWPVKGTSSCHECYNITSDNWNWNRCSKLPCDGMSSHSSF